MAVDEIYNEIEYQPEIKRILDGQGIGSRIQDFVHPVAPPANLTHFIAENVEMLLSPQHRH